MKIIIIFYIILTAFCINSGCSNETVTFQADQVFSVKNQKVFYKDNILKGADADSFVIMKDQLCKGDTGGVHCFATDKNAFYYFNIRTEADTDTFEFIDAGYMKDKNNVYYIFENSIAGDKNNIYVKGAHPGTFKILANTDSAIAPYPYAKDKNQVYYDGKVVNGADTATFAPANGGEKYDAKDKRHIYKEGDIVQ